MMTARMAWIFENYANDLVETHLVYFLPEANMHVSNYGFVLAETMVVRLSLASASQCA